MRPSSTELANGHATGARWPTLPVMPWRDTIHEVLASTGGVATRRQLLEMVPATVLDGHVGRGQLRRVYPHVYAARRSPAGDEALLRAALLHAGEGAALSHTTALHVWRLWPLEHPLHLTIEQRSKRAGAQGLVVHRRNHFDVESDCTLVRGLRITELARSVIDAWPLLDLPGRRPLLLDVVREGRATTKQLRSSLAERPNVGGHRALAQAIDLAEDGCQSELEAMGVLSVFRHRSLPRSVGQFRVELRDGHVRLDRAWPEVKLAVELDGARFHTNPEDRRRDLARDAALAVAGWVVLRFTYADVLRDPDGVRARVLAAYCTRAAQLRAS